MKEKKSTRRAAPDKVRGPAHVFAAFGYSMSGLARLVLETAFGLEVVGLFALVGLFVIVGAGWEYTLGLVILFLILFAVEALNTALECIVDEISPNYSEFAKHTKDLGSLAVFFNLSAIVIFSVFVVIQNIALS